MVCFEWLLSLPLLLLSFLQCNVNMSSGSVESGYNGYNEEMITDLW